jgi:hypothetical protein
MELSADPEPSKSKSPPPKAPPPKWTEHKAKLK